jgi:hypothetical protein
MFVHEVWALPNRLKKNIQIGWIAGILLSSSILANAPAHAIDVSQVLGGNLSWECGLSPAMQPTLRSNRDGDNRVFSCQSPLEQAPKNDPAAINQLIQQGLQLLQQAQTIATNDPAAVKQLIQQGLQLLQTAQPTTTSADPAVKQLIQQGLQLLQTAKPVEQSLPVPK